jgi:shikimate dehydrogenase
MNKFFKLGLIGYPLGHSLSPILHSAAFQTASLHGRYDTYPIAPHENDNQLQEILSRVPTGELQGLNVTIPHKQAVIPFLDRLTPIAGSVGAVNTIYFKDKKLVGDNTDAEGFLTDLKRFYKGEPSTALILGAGGSAHAVAAALLSDDWTIIIAARRQEQVSALITHIEQISPDIAMRSSGISYNQEELKRAVIKCNLVVNTTPLGMYPQTTALPWLDGVVMPSDVLVYDLVYNPIQTAFVRFSQESGAEGVNGLGMLVEQAALSFQLWTGGIPDRDSMYAAARQQLVQKNLWSKGK